MYKQLAYRGWTKQRFNLHVQQLRSTQSQETPRGFDGFNAVNLKFVVFPASLFLANITTSLTYEFSDVSGISNELVIFLRS